MNGCIFFGWLSQATSESLIAATLSSALWEACLCAEHELKRTSLAVTSRKTECGRTCHPGVPWRACIVSLRNIFELDSARVSCQLATLGPSSPGCCDLFDNLGQAASHKKVAADVQKTCRICENTSLCHALSDKNTSSQETPMLRRPEVPLRCAAPAGPPPPWQWRVQETAAPSAGKSEFNLLAFLLLVASCS